MERWWFRRQFAQQRELGDLYCTDEFRDGDFDLVEATGAEADFATFAAECGLAHEAAAGRVRGGALSQLVDGHLATAA